MRTIVAGPPTSGGLMRRSVIPPESLDGLLRPSATAAACQDQGRMANSDNGPRESLFLYSLG